MYRTLHTLWGGMALLLLSSCATAPGAAPLPPHAGPREIAAADLQRQCGGSRAAMNCYSEQLLHILENDGVAAAMEVLEALALRDPGVQREGHMYAHHIGLAANPAPDAVSETFRECTPAFQSGCYHGVIQAYFAEVTGAGAGITAGAIDGLCAEYRESEDDRWLRFQCVHGLGHGLTLLHDFHLPSALGGCDHLSDEWDREGCYGGVFMESIVNATAPHHTVGRPDAGGHAHGHAGGHAAAEDAGADGHAHHGAAAEQPSDHAAHGAHGEHGDHAAHDEHGAHGDHGDHDAAMAMTHDPFPPLDPNDPLYPCSVLDDRYLVACYQMQTSAILYHNGQDVQATAAACDDAPERYRGYCYSSLGRDISAITLQDHTRARAACDVGDPEYRVWCHIGYTKNLVDLTADPADAIEYCRGVQGSELKQACYHAVGEEIWVLTSEVERGEEWCAMAESGHREHCRRGAGLASWRDAEAG